jgi:hypothetical protein
MKLLLVIGVFAIIVTGQVAAVIHALFVPVVKILSILVK